MLNEAVIGLNALSTALTMARGLKDIDNAVNRNAAVIDLQEQILAAQQAQATLLSRVSELEKEVAELKAWDIEKQRYELTAVGTGVFAYVIKKDLRGADPQHHLCANCYANGHKAILQKEVTDVGRWTVLVCPRCRTELYPDGGGRQSSNQPRGKATFGRGR